jgi:hypothetical protein
MSETITVESGDTVSRLADARGFVDYHAIWDHPQNAELRDARQNPNLLVPGDKVFIPDHDVKVVAAKTEKVHTFVRRRAKLELRLRLRDALGEPFADTEVQLAVDGKNETLVTDADGNVSLFISAAAKKAELAFGGSTYDLQIGHLDPADQESGLRARLRNLGYLLVDDEEVTEEDVQFAIELFQMEQGLTVDGTATSALVGKLEEIHGS